MKMIKTRNALKICYYMMAADGLVQDSERAKFDELGIMLDEQFPKYKEQLVWECRQKGLFSPDREIVYLIMDYVEKELEEILDADQEAIRALAPLTRAVLEQEHICVVGNENRLKEEKELFDELREL